MSPHSSPELFDYYTSRMESDGHSTGDRSGGLPTAAAGATFLLPSDHSDVDWGRGPPPGRRHPNRLLPGIIFLSAAAAAAGSRAALQTTPYLKL